MSPPGATQSRTLGRRLLSPLGDRRVLRGAFVAYLVVLLYLVLSPQPDAPGTAITGVVDLLRSVGFPRVTPSQVEVGLNVVLFVPLGLLGSLLWRRVPWWAWAGVGLALTGAIEGFQGAFLASRVASWSDVVANTLGALVGAGTVAFVRREASATRTGRTARPPLLSPRVLVGLAAALLAGLALAVFTPTSQVQASVVNDVSRVLADLGAPAWLASTDLWERLLNIALFVPAGILGALVRPGWSLGRWAVVGLGASLCVEVTQGTLLPGRDASAYDVVMNGLGALVGAMLVHTFLRFRQETKPLP